MNLSQLAKCDLRAAVGISFQREKVPPPKTRPNNDQTMDQTMPSTAATRQKFLEHSQIGSTVLMQDESRKVTMI